MTKTMTLISVSLMLPVGSLFAQALQPDTLLMSAVQKMEQDAQEEDDASDFTFTESQLDEDLDAAQTVSAVQASNSDLYLSQVGFRWSAMRFRVRAYDNVYSTSYLNGLAFNDMETGRFNYSLLGGLNDATRNKEGVSAFEHNTFGVTGIGGGNNTNLRASQFQQGQKVTLTACNRNYRYRGMYTYGSGVMENGWAIGATVGYRGATEGVIEGTFYNSFSYLLSIEKRLSEAHTMALVTFGSPTERAAQGASTEEVYWLANSHYYNPNWGYQNGEKRNARVVNDYEPTTIFSWDWNIDQQSSLSTSLGFKYAKYSSSSIGWTGQAYDPRPDYYKNLPSSVFNVYDPAQNTMGYLSDNPFLMNAYNSLKDQWDVKANRQINWDRMYFVNRQNEVQGGEALYYLERRHNDQRVWALSSTYNRSIDQHSRLTGGVQLNATTGIHYKTMDDLLGGTMFTDVDKYASKDYGINSIQAQSDRRHPNRKIGKDDKFGYNYETQVNYAQLWAEYLYTRGSFNANLLGHIDGTMMQRNGLYQNGQGQIEVIDPSMPYDYEENGKHYYDNSYGKSGWAKFFGGGAKMQANWRPYANQRISVGASWEKKAPLMRNAFVNARAQNNYVNNLGLEDILSAEAAWYFQIGELSGKAAGYWSEFRNGVEQTAFFNDAMSSFTYLTMSKMNRRHCGVELSLEYEINSDFKVHAMGTYGDAKYTNNPYAQLNCEGMDAKDNTKVNAWKNPVTGQREQLRVAMKNMKVNSTPLTALNIGANYNYRRYFIEVELNWYDRVYCGPSAYRRLTNIMPNQTNTSINEQGLPVYSLTEQEIRENGAVLFDASTGNISRIYGAQQEKFHPGFMLDASVGRYIRLKHSRSMSINLSLQNLTNNTNLRTGGYEQNRDDNYYNTYGTGDGSKGQAKAYKFSRNSKYYYANALNAFLNVNFRF